MNKQAVVHLSLSVHTCCCDREHCAVHTKAGASISHRENKTKPDFKKITVTERQNHFWDLSTVVQERLFSVSL